MAPAEELRQKKSAALATMYPDAERAGADAVPDRTIEDFICAIGTIAVSRWEPEKVTAGGIHLPDRFQEERSIGTVASVASNEEDYQIGDVVMFRGCGTPLSLAGKEYLLLQRMGAIDDDILGRFKRDGELDVPAD